MRTDIAAFSLCERWNDMPPRSNVLCSVWTIVTPASRSAAIITTPSGASSQPWEWTRSTLRPIRTTLGIASRKRTPLITAPSFTRRSASRSGEPARTYLKMGWTVTPG